MQTSFILKQVVHIITTVLYITKPEHDICNDREYRKAIPNVEQITVAARSKAGVVVSNPTEGMDVCVRLFCVCVVLCVGRGITTG
jgi:hypothetical protein